jgi:hypothetical protein
MCAYGAIRPAKSKFSGFQIFHFAGRQEIEGKSIYLPPGRVAGPLMHLPYSDLLWNASSSLQIALQRDREKAALNPEKGRPYNKGGAPFTGHNARVSPRVPSAVKNYVLVVVKRSE